MYLYGFLSYLISFFFLTDEKPSNMELRAKCITTMQAAEYAVEHSVSDWCFSKKVAKTRHCDHQLAR